MTISRLKRWLMNSQVFLPVSTFMIIWYFIVLIIILIDFMLTVVFICFQNAFAQRSLRQGILPEVLAICVLDILISFNTSFIKNGRIIKERKLICHNYIFSWYFCFDLLALIVAALQLILRQVFQTKFPFLNFLIFIKIVKGAEFDTLIKKYAIKSVSVKLYYQMIKSLVLIILVCHTIGSFFFYLDLKLIEAGWYNQDYLWVYSSYAYLNIIDLDPIWQYTYSFYYAVVTLSGTAYGDLTPLNPTEVIYTFVSVALPMIVYAYLFSAINCAISQRRKRSVESTNYKNAAQNYFRKCGFTEVSSRKFMSYLSYVYDRKIALDGKLIENLAPSVKDVYIRDQIDRYYDFSLFSMLTRPALDISLIKEIIYKIAVEETYPEKEVIQVTKLKKKLYFIRMGEVANVLELKQKFSKKIEKCQFIGKYEFFCGLLNPMPKFWFETTKLTVCQCLQFTNFNKYVRENIALLQAIHSLKDQLIIGNQYALIKQKCFFCQESSHLLQNCDKLRPKILVTELYAGRQQRGASVRRDCKVDKQKFFKPINQMKKSRALAGMKHDRATLTEFMTFSIEEQKTIREVEFKEAIKKVDCVFNWTIFYPRSSFPEVMRK